MEVTEQLLENLGAKLIHDNSWHSNTWELMMHGYRFRFVKNSGFWNFKWGEDPHNYHAVTHLEECLGFIAKDAFDAGRDDAKREIREVLGVN